MEEVKNVPELRFQADDAEYFDWEKRKLGEIGEIVNGLTYSPNDIVEDGLLVMRSSNIQNGLISFKDNVYVDVSDYNELKEDDILICVRNGSRRLIGKNVLIPESVQGQAFGAFMTVFRSDMNKFIHQAFQTRTFKWNVHRNLGATINSINGGNLKKMSFYLPSLSEQKKIADFLSAVDERIDILTRKKELIQLYKKGMFQQLFPRKGETTPQLRFKADRPNGGADDGSAFPEWEEKRLGELSQLTSSKRVYQSDYVSKGIPFYRGKEISELQKNFQPKDILYISEDKYQLFKENYGVPVENDILITSVGTLGNVWRIPDKRAFYFKDGNLIWLKKIGCNSSFLVHFFEISHNRLLRSAIGSSQKALTIVGLSKIKINLPTPPEQKKIADFLSTIDEQIETVTAQVEHMKTWKRGLLQKMFV